MIGRPPSSTLFPYTPLFRSVGGVGDPASLEQIAVPILGELVVRRARHDLHLEPLDGVVVDHRPERAGGEDVHPHVDRKSTRLNSSHLVISYAVFCLKKKKTT